MEYARNDIRNIAYEKINDRFSKGKYLDIEVTIDMTNGYVNGSHLVRQVKTRKGKYKEFFHWKETKSARLCRYRVEPTRVRHAGGKGWSGDFSHGKRTNLAAGGISPRRCL